MIMLDIREIKEKYNDQDELVIKNEFQELLSDQWTNMNKYFKTQEISESIKYRTLYLYDEIRNSIEDKFENINKSFFILYNKRLYKVDKLHSNEYQKCLDILNLFSDIDYYLENVDDVNLKNFYHLNNGVRLLAKNNNLSEEGILC